MNICFFGSGSRKTDDIYTKEAYKLGCLIAENNDTLIFGGGNTGMMGACAKGVHDNMGKSIGIAPKWIGDFEPLCEDCSEFIYVKSMDERKQEFLNKSDVFIIAPGGIGTLDEFFEVITLKKLKVHDKYIIVLNINNFYDTMLKMIDEMSEKGFLYNQEEIFKIADSTDDILKYLK